VWTFVTAYTELGLDLGQVEHNVFEGPCGVDWMDTRYGRVDRKCVRLDWTLLDMLFAQGPEVQYMVLTLNPVHHP
jgi:hypothetical protein